MEKASQEGTAAVEPQAPAAEAPAAEAAPEARGGRPARRVEVDLSHARERRLVAFLDNHPVAEQYRKLRTQVRAHAEATGDRCFLITSPGEGDGKTLTALNLAIAMAREIDQTVLLVDANLRQPAVAQTLGLSPEAGLGDYLEGKAEVPDCLLRTNVGKLVLFPGVGSRGDAAELLDSQRMRALVAELKGRYPDRTILFDAPGVEGVADPIVLSRWVDRVLVVVREGVTTADALERALSVLPHDKLLGTVLTASTEAAGG
ncbi:MAG: exopolysaccharide biosynthesis protein [Nitrospirae bacterium]|nr:MAG: exopolysaccharide biosynthesis protein [Nitrospirota bacterium]